MAAKTWFSRSMSTMSCWRSAAAATSDSELAQIIVVAGPEPITLAKMLRESAARYGRRLRILPLPTGLLVIVARILTIFLKTSPFSVAELQRSREDKNYDIDLLRSQLGIEPRSFVDGLRQLGVRHFENTNLGCTQNSAGG